MDNTIIWQGEYKQADVAVDKYIVLRGGVDWMEVVNWTQSVATNADCGTHYYWQRGMADGIGLCYFHPAANTTLGVQACAAGSGFTYVDTTDTAPGAARILNGAFATNVPQPIVSSANTAGLATGSIVRLSGTTTAMSLSGWDFQIDTVVDGVSFRMAYAMQQAAGAAATAGYYRIIPYDPIFYPRWRYIVNITAANPAVIHTSVDHGYTVGQKIRVNLPDAKFGMVEINGVEAIVTATTAGTITTNIDSSGFTAFEFALPATLPNTMPTIVPIGIDMGTAITGAVNILADATYNTGYIGMKLHVGALAGANLGTLSPAGSNVTTGAGNGDIIKWRAGKSFSDLNET